MKKDTPNPLQENGSLLQNDDLNARQLLEYAKDLADVYKQEKEKRKSLETSREKIKTIIAGMSNGMLATDNEHRIIEVNPVACKLLESEQDELIGRNFLEMDDFSPIREKLSFFLEAGDESRENMFELELPNRRQIRLHASRLKADQGFVYVIRDITSEKRTENAKNTLLGILSHELRTPLASILNFTQLLTAELAGHESPEVQQYLEHILHNGFRLENTFNDLLEFIQLERDYLEITEAESHLDDILREVKNALQPEIKDRNIRINTSIETDNPNITGNPQLLISLFTQVLHNAVVYSPRNGEVDITATGTPEHIRIVVKDKGAGIPAVEMDNIFTGFYQVQDHESGGYEGLGLGLSIAKRIAEQHNGTIDLESAVNAGTKCIITLPRNL